MRLFARIRDLASTSGMTFCISLTSSAFVCCAELVPTFFIREGSDPRFLERLVYFPKYASILL